MQITNLTIMSGGQTGVDRAALDMAMRYDIDIAGYCPKGRRAEDGPIDSRYPLEETETSHYSERTRKNIEESDATLILTVGPMSGGTRLTWQLAQELDKPVRVEDLSSSPDAKETAEWIKSLEGSRLNIAGPRENVHRTVYSRALGFISDVIRQLLAEDEPQ